MSTTERNAALGLERGAVRLVAANPHWPVLYGTEADALAAALREHGLRPLAFEHIGSTAVPGLVAKPIIDLMAGYTSEDDSERYMETFVTVGYEVRGPQGVPGREFLVRGPEVARTHHLNLVAVGGTFWREQILFRDLLRADPNLALEYATLKRVLAARHTHDRELYTAGKARFITTVLKRAHAEPAR